jgi:hypothetical protein
VLSGFLMEYVEAYASREGFVLPRDGKVLWSHSVRFHPILQHGTRSRGWYITERVNDNIGNEIELRMVIPTDKGIVTKAHYLSTPRAHTGNCIIRVRPKYRYSRNTS